MSSNCSLSQKRVSLHNDRATRPGNGRTIRSPKAEDVRACPRTTLVHQQRDETYLLATAHASVEHDEGFVAATIERFEAESDPYGYRPSDFWPDEQLERVVTVRLDLIRIELTTFTNDEMEVKRWVRARSSSALETLPG